jgi:inositol transport system substrate-binding protein
VKKTPRNRLIGIGAIALAAALAISGCSSTSPSGSSTSGASGKTVGATLLSLQYPFLVTLNDEMKKEATAKGLKLTSLDPRQSTATEQTQIENLIAQKVNAIVMIPVDPKASQAAAKEVNAAKIPLIVVNTQFSSDFTGKYVCYIGSDDSQAGQIQGDYLAKTLPDGGNVIYLVTQYGGSSTELRKAAFDKVLKAHPNLHVVSELADQGSRAAAKSTMENLLQKYPKGTVQAVVAQNDEMAIGASAAIYAAGRQSDFKVIEGIDGSAAGLAAVKDGTMTATVFQDAVGQGKQAMEVAAEVLAGKSVPKKISIPFQLVTKANLSQYLK